MGLFKKKKPAEPVAQYTPPEAMEPPVPEPKPIEDWEKDHKQMLANQAVLAQNQQLILNAIGALAQRIEHLAGETEEPPAEEEAPREEEEYTDEEIQEALRLAREKKAAAKKKGAKR